MTQQEPEAPRSDAVQAYEARMQAREAEQAETEARMQAREARDNWYAKLEALAREYKRCKGAGIGDCPPPLIAAARRELFEHLDRKPS